ncbi:MAG: biopolymer transporter ExbD [Kiritimatiellia bacterium]|nr:biopolymer transporter ExbD [Kiritimatiellia bacterium]
MARKPQEDPKLDMTPMIDVVFELIIFFVVTIQQENLFTKLNVNRPAPADSTSSSKDDDITVNIEIGRARSGNPNGVIIYNKKELGPSSFTAARKELDQNLREIARTSKKTPIIVKCAENSPHKALVDVLDICYKNELFSVSVFTL